MTDSLIRLTLASNPHDTKIEIDGKHMLNVVSLTVKVHAERLTIAELELICNVEIDGQMTLQTERWSCDRPAI